MYKVVIRFNYDSQALWVESLANPTGMVHDLEALADLAHGAGVPFIVDNTMVG